MTQPSETIVGSLEPHSSISRSVLFKRTTAQEGDIPQFVSLNIRPITPDDVYREAECVKRMSVNSKYLRFFAPKMELTDEEVHYYTHINYKTSFALAAVDPETDSFVSIARYMEDDVAVLVLDAWQGYLIGQYVTDMLFDIARREGKKELKATILTSNIPSVKIFERLTHKFKSERTVDGRAVSFEYDLTEKKESSTTEGTFDPYRNSAIARRVNFSHNKTAETIDLVVRPITPDDERREAKCVKSMSVEAKYQRFFHAKSELSDVEIHRYTHIDYRNEMALVAVNPKTDDFVAICRYMKEPGSDMAELAVLVLDGFHGYGIGFYLCDYILDLARTRKVSLMNASSMSNNQGMLRILEKLSSKHSASVVVDGSLVRYTYSLKPEKLTPVMPPISTDADMSSRDTSKVDKDVFDTY